MANPNPSPATRFGPDNPGRAKQKGARDRLSAAFLTAFAGDFEVNGLAVIEKVRDADPSTYLRIAAAIIPKEVQVSDPLENWSDEMLEAAITVLNALSESPEAIAATLKGRLGDVGEHR